VAEPLRIAVEGDTVRIEWDDGRHDTLAASALRAACPCAGCREPAETARLASPAAGEGVTVQGGRLVGGYALSLTFGPDGHATGIFPFGLLRSLGGDAG
jgi:DUF971 family protein